MYLRYPSSNNQVQPENIVIDEVVTKKPKKKEKSKLEIIISLIIVYNLLPYMEQYSSYIDEHLGLLCVGFVGLIVLGKVFER